LEPILNAREELANLDETNVRRQAEFARALYLTTVMAREKGKPNDAMRNRLKKSKEIMRELGRKVQLTAEQQRWATEIEKAK
jgi:hypothetical protein